jgi:hypothetical protein
VRIRRAFIASGAEVLSSSAIYEWTHARRRLGRRKTLPDGIYWGTLQALRVMCEPVERVPPHGAWLWRGMRRGSFGLYACRPNDIGPLCNVRVPLKTDSKSRWG